MDGWSSMYKQTPTVQTLVVQGSTVLEDAGWGGGTVGQCDEAICLLTGTY